MPYDESDDYDVYEIIDQAYNEADRMSRPIHLLLETYQKYEEHDPNADRVADDNEALEWLDDYWEYVKWNEHGNESSIDEVGGFKGFARTVTDSNYVDSTLNYLIYEDDPELIDPTARDLADRLKIIANRYGALRKMKKGAGIKKYYNIAVRQTSRDDWVYYDAVAGYGDADKSNATRYDDLESAIREKDKLAENFPHSDFAVVDSDGYDAQTFKILVFENPDYMASTKKMKKMSFTERVCQYIKNNYDIPDKMEFYIGTEEYDFKDWVDAYVEEFNNNVTSPYGDDSDENDVEVVAEEILQIMTAPYKMGNEYVINYDDFEASTKKSQDIHLMIASIRKNNNSLKKTRVDVKNNAKKENIVKMSWDDYKKLKRAYDNGTVDALINGMNNILPGYGNQFEALFEACMNVGSLKEYIFNNFVPIEMPPLVRGRTNFYDSEGDGIVQFNFDGDGLSAMIRFTVVRNTDVTVTVCLWDNHLRVDEESQTYTDVDIDWIDGVFSDANEIFRGICQSYINMVRGRI